ncbi:MAG: hypothetical protein HRT47_01480 [Candidatus Caenarcaniphilales bacterium]|nr:hypothetical protein [Candidatus Caenarcaniphilales bacterium]
MADSITPLLNDINPANPGTHYGDPVSTQDLRDFAIILSMPTTTGTVADTLDIFIEESEESNFNSVHRIRDVRLYPVDGSANVGQLTRVTGNLTSPNPLLQQKFNINDKNLNTWIRARYEINNNATSFTNVRLSLAANLKI